MKTIRLVCKIVALLLAMIGTSASAQGGYSWDSVMVKNVQVWYPGPPDSGKIRAELWWHHPDEPYSYHCGALEIFLKWNEPTSIVCDSMRSGLQAMLDSVDLEFDVNNEMGIVYVGMQRNFNYAFYFLPGQYHIADIYFTVMLPAVFSTDSLVAPVFGFPPFTLFWHGRQFATANIVADPGDFNGDGTVNISDCVYGISYVFGPFDEPVPCGDANGSCFTNISDIVYLINYLFAGGPEPEAGCAFWR